MRIGIAVIFVMNKEDRIYERNIKTLKDVSVRNP